VRRRALDARYNRNTVCKIYMSSANAHLALPLGTVYSLEGGKGEEGVCKKLIFALSCV
jgi:hypothetical protein